MVGKAKHRTQADQDRIDICKRYVSCLPCLIVGFSNAPSDYHHVKDGDRRVGHQHGYPVCLWHHKGERDFAIQHIPMQQIRRRLGPSLAREPRAYHDRFGSEDLLVELADFAVELYTVQPWGILDMPMTTKRKILQKFNELMHHEITC